MTARTASNQAVRDHMRRIDVLRRWIRRLEKMRRRVGYVVPVNESRSARA